MYIQHINILHIYVLHGYIYISVLYIYIYVYVCRYTHCRYILLYVHHMYTTYTNAYIHSSSAQLLCGFPLGPRPHAVPPFPLTSTSKLSNMYNILKHAGHRFGYQSGLDESSGPNSTFFCMELRPTST